MMDERQQWHSPGGFRTHYLAEEPNPTDPHQWRWPLKALCGLAAPPHQWRAGKGQLCQKCARRLPLLSDTPPIGGSIDARERLS